MTPRYDCGQKTPRLECAPGAGENSGCCFDHLPGVVVLELGGAQIAEG